MQKTVLAIDIGATKIEAGVVDETGSILSRCKLPTPAEGDAAEVLGVVLAAVDQAADGQSPRACGVGVCGASYEDGVVWTLNIASWRDYRLGDELRARLSLPVAIENDANSMTVAEGRWGAARGVSNYVSLVVSTGVGGGIVVNGELLRGNGRAGRLGHVSVDPDGRRCGCGGLGCLEAEASGTAIEMMTSRPAEAAPPEVIERTGTMVGRSVATVANMLDVHLAIIGGSVALGFGRPFFEAAQREASSRSTLGLRNNVEIQVVPPGLGRDAPLLGAATVALDVR